MKKILIYIIICLAIASCGNSNSGRSDLHELNLKGDVVKLEIITQTTIPISEWLYSTISSIDYTTSFRNNAVYSFVGNSVLTFNDDGNIVSQTIFDNRGNILFEGEASTVDDVTLYEPINIKGNELLADWTFELDDSSRIIRQKTLDNKKLSLDRAVYYNSRGDIDYVTCKFPLTDIKEFGYENADTTFFSYTQYDSKGNWTECTIEHRGHQFSDSYKMNVRRQITYNDEAEKPALIHDLKTWNKKAEEAFSCQDVEMKEKSFYDSKLKLNMPINVELELPSSTRNSLLYKLKDGEGFFSVCIAKQEQNVDIDTYENSQETRDALSKIYGSNGVYILEWNAYSNNNYLEGKRCLHMAYYFYATGGYTNTGDPIMTETWEFPDNAGGNMYCVTVAYDTNHKYLYKPWTEKIKKSITINF